MSFRVDTCVLDPCLAIGGLQMTTSHFRSVSVLAIVAALTACGTTTTLQAPDDAAASIDLGGYDAVVVGNFENEATASKAFKGKDATSKKQTHQADADAAAGAFADLIVSELRKTNAFSQVSRGDTPQPGAIWIDGKVTRYERGNAAARLFVGMGAGSSYFDAVVNVRDPETRNVLGSIVVDRNSWVLGGGIAAGQNVDNFMRKGAQKVADELKTAKLGITDE